ncbi:hypothetical protein EVAR_40574_1 [Eumeta japonica]|uniref:Uncharacterized protein n=1 Tax=Eumeta variegata TaxID=151549 RepID=A0A4C1VYW9_EUMVA|nr:hypothetical protein EVAR_40574_1 [Eumeta japonica]
MSGAKQSLCPFTKKRFMAHLPNLHSISLLIVVRRNVLVVEKRFSNDDYKPDVTSNALPPGGVTTSKGLRVNVNYGCCSNIGDRFEGTLKRSRWPSADPLRSDDKADLTLILRHQACGLL